MNTAARLSPERVGSVTLGMPELAMAGLSEPWLLRHLGDLHWRLIADVIGSRTASFRDAAGAPVYAAFCAISIRIDRPDLARLGAELRIQSRLGGVSATRLLSRHDLRIGDHGIGSVRMISAFLGHDETGRNRALRRARPMGLPMLEPVADDFVTEAAALARGRAEDHPGLASETMVITPAPADFNAARLLYFPSFPALADRAAWIARRALPPGETAYRRDIVYLGNLDLGEDISISWSRPTCPDAGQIVRLTRTDGAPLAVIVTRPSGS